MHVQVMRDPREGSGAIITKRREEATWTLQGLAEETSKIRKVT